MCVAYHPKNPSLVAAGSFNGEVFVWDTEPDEYRFYSSGIGDYFHREPVTNIAWVYDVQAAEYNVRLEGRREDWHHHTHPTRPLVLT